jgi:hypothetical protein
MPQLTISERDAAYPDFNRADFESELLRRSNSAQPGQAL